MTLNISKFVKYSPFQKQVRFAYTISDEDEDEDEDKDEDKYNETTKNNFNLIQNNDNLKTYVTRIYKYTCVGFGTSIATSMAVSYGTTLITNPNMFTPLVIVWCCNVGFGFYSIYKMNKLQSVTNNDMTETIPEQKKSYYKLFSISNGITLAPLVGIAFRVNPMIVPVALTGTLATFGGATYYALKQYNLDKISWQAPLVGCVTGLLCTNLLTLSASFLGFTKFASNMDFISTLVSTGVFTALIVVDTHIALQDYKNKTLDTINTTTNMLLDATNLFIDFVKLLIKIKSD
jgi:hypothetical protein